MSNAGIVNRYKTSLRFAFLEAVRDVDEQWKRDPNIPVDVGRLRRGLELNITSSTGTRMEAVAKSTATASGSSTDYPAILEALPRIAPTKAKYLHFTVNGQDVFSKGFANSHFGWWSKLWRGGDLWYDAVAKQIARKF